VRMSLSTMMLIATLVTVIVAESSVIVRRLTDNPSDGWLFWPIAALVLSGFVRLCIAMVLLAFGLVASWCGVE
jgi:hypothetical protein